MTTGSAEHRDSDVAILLVSLGMVAACAITYELLIGTVSSYYLGSSVLHFSLTIGLFMFFLGIGAFLSKFVSSGELEVFVWTELLLGFVGMGSVLVLQASFSLTDHYYLVALVLLGTIATLCGLEVPLLTRMIHRHQGLSATLAHALSIDYVGGLIGSVLFPIVLLPSFGTLKTGCLVGILNISIASLVVYHFRRVLRRISMLAILCAAGVVLGIFQFATAERLVSILEQAVYDDEIVYADQSAYQRIILTQHKDDLRLYLNGDLQFSSLDEHRYHEPLVHIPMQLAKQRGTVLLLGGGDGLAAREILSYPEVSSLTIVDLDDKVTALATHHALMRAINKHSLTNPRVTMIHEDAWRFVHDTDALFDVVIADLPDANDYALGKLYSVEFYRRVSRVLAPGGVFITQAASPFFTRNAFWCIAHTVAAAFPFTTPLHNTIPSFGSWGYILASHSGPLSLESLTLPSNLRYLTNAILPTLTIFDGDTSEVPTAIQRLDSQVLVKLYADGWDRFN
jgi:spermidine synthase